MEWERNRLKRGFAQVPDFERYSMACFLNRKLKPS
jgi:hypothetical protein